jgi:heme/copper-type cytochrome/quinol oxidase subunit 2
VTLTFGNIANECGRAIRPLAFFLAAGCLLLAPIHVHAQEPAKPPAPAPAPQTQAEPLLIEILADHDSRYKITGQEKPVITLSPGQEVRLRITAVKAKNRNRDGSIHGFTLLRSKDRTPVPGWDFLLMPGVQDFLVTAPAEPGDYVVVCTVICSSGHEQMNMKVVVVSKGG